MRLLLALVALLCGCSVPAVTPDGANEDALFPHAEGFGDAGQHGQEYLGEHAGSCVRCHDLSAGAQPGGADGCHTCHADFPHGEQWLQAHGGSWLDLDRRSTCASCHGEDLAGGAADVACDSCHAAWPHPVGWRFGDVHAAFLAARGTVDSCLGCHAAESVGTSDVPGCGDCHGLYPHTQGWSQGDVHGAAWVDGACGTCHGEIGGGGTWAPSCSTCHPAYPHGAAWRLEHPASVWPAGEAACLLCHEPGDGSDVLPVSCASACHGSAPGAP